MPFQIAFERRLLNGAEFRAVEPTHHPKLKTLSREKLGDIAKALRAYHDKARDLSHQHKRAARGKPGPTAARSAQGKDTVVKKHQVFAEALKRVTARMAALDAQAKQKRTTETLKAALAKKNAAAGKKPAPGRTASAGMRSKASTKRRTKVLPAKVGRISARTRQAQAKRDKR
jgi:hypothetical protein